MKPSKLYKTKSCEIEAIEYTGKNGTEILRFMFPDIEDDAVAFDETIKTLEGEMHCSIGDFIIKGLKGEFYPCKPDIFHLKYEPCDTIEQNEEGGKTFIEDIDATSWDKTPTPNDWIEEKEIEIEIISGSEGECLAINSRRVAGPKPWGGGHTVKSFKTTISEIKEALNLPSLTQQKEAIEKECSDKIDKYRTGLLDELEELGYNKDAIERNNKEWREKIGKYVGHIENDGTGKSMNLSQDEIIKDIKELLK